MKSDFREEIQKRKLERRRQRSNTWFNLIIRVLAFVIIIIVIRYMGKVRANKIEQLLRSNAPDTTQIFHEEKPFTNKK